MKRSHRHIARGSQICLVVCVCLMLGGCFRSGKVNQQLQLLTSEHPAIRANAVEKLGIYRDFKSEPALIKALTDDHKQVRKNAAKALWRLRRDAGKIQPFDWMIEQLTDQLVIQPDGQVDLHRTIQFKIVSTYNSVKNIAFFLPAVDLRIQRILDRAGKQLKYKVDRRYPQPQVRVIGIHKAQSGDTRRVTIIAKSAAFIYSDPTNSDIRKLIYRPGFFNVPIQNYQFSARLTRSDYSNQLIARHTSNKLDRHALINTTIKASFKKQNISGSFPKHFPEPVIGTLNIVIAIICLSIVIAASYLFAWKKYKPDQLHLQILFVVLALGFMLFFQPFLIEDTLSYYSYARSLILDGNFTFYNDYLLHNNNWLYFYNVKEVPSPSGPFIFWAPFVACAHVLTLLINACGLNIATNGYTFPYIYAVAVGGFVYCCISAFFCYQLACKFASSSAALIATVVIIFSTNFLLIFYHWTASSFQPSVLIFSVFLYYWYITIGRRQLYGWGILGLLAGLMIQIRYQNGLLLIIPFIEWIRSFASTIRSHNITESGKLIGAGVIFLITAIIAFSPQLVLFKMLGDSFWIDTYRTGDVARFNFDYLSEALAGIFWDGHVRGYYNGLISNSPVLVLAVIGMFSPRLRASWISWTLLTALVLQIVLVGSYINWDGKLLYVPNLYFVTLSPIFILGLAVFLDYLQPLTWRCKLFWTSLITMLALINLYNIYLQLAFKQAAPFPEHFSLSEGMQRLIFLPEMKFRNDFVELSGNFAIFLRGLSQSILTTNITELFITILLWLIPVIIVFILFFWWSKLPLDRYIATNSKRQANTAVFSVVVVFLLLDTLVIKAARKTDKNYHVYKKNLIRKPIYPSVMWGKLKAISSPSKSWQMEFVQRKISGPMSHLHLLGYLRNTEQLRQDTVVARVTIQSTNRQIFTADLRVGVHFGDIAFNRPESQADIAHNIDNIDVAYDWDIRDGSQSYFRGNIYLCHIQLPMAIIPESLTITYQQSTGELVLTGIRMVEPSIAWPAHMLGQPLLALEKTKP